jgi:hypothetical protein
LKGVENNPIYFSKENITLNGSFTEVEFINFNISEWNISDRVYIGNTNSNTEDIITAEIEDELFNMTAEKFQTYEFGIFNDYNLSNGFVYANSSTYGFLNFGIKDSTINIVTFYFNDPDYKKLEIDNQSKDIYLVDNSLIEFSLFPNDDTNNLYKALRRSPLDSIIFNGEFINYKFIIGTNKKSYYNNLFMDMGFE